MKCGKLICDKYFPTNATCLDYFLKNAGALISGIIFSFYCFKNLLNNFNYYYSSFCSDGTTLYSKAISY